jgi:thiosulfate reductase cytochrome b subunit
VKTKKAYVYRSFERFWHWLQAVLIIFLAFTGFEIHGSYSFFGFEEAVNYHTISSYLLVALIILAIFWHFATGEWKQYVPSTKNMKAQLNYYLLGIFKNAPHPTKKTVLSKLNPMQKFTYFELKVVLIPLSLISGILYLFYRYPQGNQIDALNIDSLEIIAIVHTVAAFSLIAFLIVHVYLITTGETITSNLRAMMTGYEELEDEDSDEYENELEEEIKEKTQVNEENKL